MCTYEIKPKAGSLFLLTYKCGNVKVFEENNHLTKLKMQNKFKRMLSETSLLFRLVLFLFVFLFQPFILVLLGIGAEFCFPFRFFWSKKYQFSNPWRLVWQWTIKRCYINVNTFYLNLGLSGLMLNGSTPIFSTLPCLPNLILLCSRVNP